MMSNLKMFRFGVLMIVVLAIAQGVIIYIPQETEAAFSATVTVGLDQAEQTALVAPGQKGVVTFTGTVHCTVPLDTSVQKVLVSLQANAGGWPWSLTPSTMVFDRQVKDAVFTVSVRVPPRTPHLITQQLIIDGKWYIKPGILSGPVFPATAMINVRQFYKFQLECSKPFVEVSPGDRLTFQLRIKNEGNDQDTVRLSLDPKTEKDLNNMGWAVMLPASEYVIDAGSEEVIRITVMPKQKWNLWKNEVTTIKIKIYSFQAMSLGEIPVETTYSLYVRERGYSTPGYEMYLVVFGLICIGLVTAGFSTRKVARMRRRRR
jgi:hypothetical protein